MQIMIILYRIEILSIARSFVLANTPYSLYQELSINPVIKKICDGCSLQELTRYYDYVTARAIRTDISMALAYSVFIAVNMKLRELGQLLRSQIDTSRLRWGHTIQEYMQMSGTNTQTLLISPQPIKISSTESPGVNQEANRSNFSNHKIWRPENDSK
jgi:hypothetical protein